MTKRVRKTTRKAAVRGIDPGGLIGAVIDPVGPVNVFNEKIAAADAVNRAIETQTAYEAAHPPGPPPEPPDRTPIGEPIGPGGPIVPDKTKFVIDRAPGNRVVRKRWF